MISFFYIAFNCKLCILIIQLIIPASSSIFYLNHISLLELSTSCIMQVTTRSQTERLTTFSVESSMTSTFLSTNLLDVSNYQPNATIIHEANQWNDTFDYEASLNTFGMNKLSSMVLDTVEFQNLKSSMVFTCPSSVSNLSPTFHPYNSEILSRNTMESDCEDFAAGSNPDSGQVDITKLFHSCPPR